MLRDQLTQAIGKVLNQHDFTEYMNFHNKRLFRREFEPRPFSVPVRMPDHYPEGVVSILAASGTGDLNPIPTISR
jgi:hypothetical protein